MNNKFEVFRRIENYKQIPESKIVINFINENSYESIAIPECFLKELIEQLNNYNK